MSALVPATGSPFDRIKQTRPDGSEFWSLRKMQGLMGYARWENLSPVIARAMQAASNTGMDVTSEFLRSQESPTGGGRPREDFQVTRQAAYLVAMNGDPNKPEVASAQAYFAVRTQQAEMVEQRVTDLPGWAVALHALVDQQAAVEVEQRRQAQQLNEISARVANVEGAHDWFAALAYAINTGLPTERGFLQRLGTRAGRILRAEGLVPGKAQHPAYGTVNTYPTWVLERAAAEMPDAAA